MYWQQYQQLLQHRGKLSMLPALQQPHLRLRCDADGVELAAHHLRDHHIVQDLDGVRPGAAIGCRLAKAQLAVLVGAPGQHILVRHTHRVLVAAGHSFDLVVCQRCYLHGQMMVVLRS